MELLRGDIVGMIAGTEPLSRAVLQHAPTLKVVSRCGIGTDNVDLSAASELGIEVLNTPDAPSVAVAELTLGLILATLRRIAEADRAVRAGEWRPLMGRLLTGRVVGVVGYGRIGRKVSALARAFGARVLAHDIQPITPDGAVELCALDELLSSSDIVTLHLPSAPANRYFFNDARLSLMKRGAILINTARGELVDEQALARVLTSTHIAAAALDTFEQEPYSGPLRDFPQVTLTAHMGSYTEESRARMEEEAARNLLDALARHGLSPAAAATRLRA